MNFQDINKMNFEQAVEELEKIAEELESGNIALENAIKYFERGNELKNFCDAQLKDAKLRVEKITANDGEISSAEMSDLQSEYE